MIYEEGLKKQGGINGGDICQSNIALGNVFTILREQEKETTLT